jgi:hypothetical protein
MVLRLSVIGQVSSFFISCGARSGGLPVEAMQRLAEIAEHVGEAARQGGSASD